MNPETKKDWKYAGGIFGVVAVLLGGGIYISQQLLPSPPTVTLAWDNAPGAVVTVVEGTTDLTNWTVLATIVATNYFTFPKTNAYMFFRVAHPNRPGHYWDEWVGGYRYNPDVFKP